MFDSNQTQTGEIVCCCNCRTPLVPRYTVEGCDFIESPLICSKCHYNMQYHCAYCSEPIGEAFRNSNRTAITSCHNEPNIYPKKGSFNAHFGFRPNQGTKSHFSGWCLYRPNVYLFSQRQPPFKKTNKLKSYIF